MKHTGAEHRREEAEAQRREWRQGLRAHIEHQRAANQSPSKVLSYTLARPTHMPRVYQPYTHV